MYLIFAFDEILAERREVDENRMCVCVFRNFPNSEIYKFVCFEHTERDFFRKKNVLTLLHWCTKLCVDVDRSDFVFVDLRVCDV